MKCKLNFRETEEIYGNESKAPVCGEQLPGACACGAAVLRRFHNITDGSAPAKRLPEYCAKIRHSGKTGLKKSQWR